MPDYAVRNTDTGDVRIVTAARPATALAHVVTPLFVVTLATAQDGIDAGKKGRRIEVAGEEPVPPGPPSEHATDALNYLLSRGKLWITPQIIDSGKLVSDAVTHGVGVERIHDDGSSENIPASDFMDDPEHLSPQTETTEDKK